MKRNFRIISILFFVVATLSAKAQNYLRKENSVWAFGERAGIDFSSGNPVAIRTPMKTREGCAAVYDKDGKPLFYTEGSFVWDKNGNVMNNGVGITALGSNALFNTSATASSAHGTVVVPMPGNPYQYYIFSVVKVEYLYTNEPWQYGRLYYSIVDVRLNGGLGDVVPGKKGILLDSNYQEKIAGTTGDACNYWLIGHDRRKALFKSWSITATGIAAQPVLSSVGIIPSKDSFANYYGGIVVSPDRTKLVITNNGPVYDSASQLFNFNAATGIISNWYPLKTPASGAAFSPNSKVVYLGQWQYDISVSPPVGFNLVDGGNDTKLGPDGKIYILNYVGAGCLRVNAPNILGINCQLQASPLIPVFLSGTSAVYNFNSEVPYLDYDTIPHKTELCFTDSIVLNVTDTNGYNYEWEDSVKDVKSRTVAVNGIYVARYFVYNNCTWVIDTFIVHKIEQVSLGRDTVLCSLEPYIIHPSLSDAMYGWQNGSKGSEHLVTQSGVYSVRATKNGCISYDTVSVQLFDLQQDLGPDVLQCSYLPIDIDLNAQVPDMTHVLWSNGEEQSTIHVNDTGLYWVKVSVAHCEGHDTISVKTEKCDCTVSVPSAFSPNGDGRNDVFRPILQKGCPVNDYQMTIYNRWGQQVFESQNITTTWNGIFNGMPAPIDTYMYTMTIKMGSSSNARNFKGDFTLVR